MRTLLEPARAQNVKYLPNPRERTEALEYWPALDSAVRDPQLVVVLCSITAEHCRGFPGSAAF